MSAVGPEARAELAKPTFEKQIPPSFSALMIPLFGSCVVPLQPHPSKDTVQECLARDTSQLGRGSLNCSHKAILIRGSQ